MKYSHGSLGAKILGGIVLLAGSLTCAAAAGGLAPHVASVIAITEVFGDGQKVSAVVLEYDSPIDTAKLGAKAFAW